MKKILIIGKKSFIGSNLRKNLSKVFYVDIFSYENVLKKKKNFFKKYTHIINTSIHKNYITKKYNKDYDFDRKLIEKFKSAKFKYFFLNTRKIYFPKQKFLVLF